MDHLRPPNSNGNNNPEDDPPPPYEEVATPQSPRPGLSTHGLPRPHSSHNPAPPSPTPSPRPTSHPPHSPNQPSPYPGQAAQAQRPPRPSQPGRPSTSHAGNPGPNPNIGPPSIPRQFPPSFSVYTQGFSRTMILAEHQTQPIYALRVHSGFGGDASLILHSGPTERHPTLASLDFTPFSLSIVVTLPPSPFPGAPSALALEPTSGFAHGGYSFTIDVGNVGPRAHGGRWPLEEFEWRRSRGDAVASLGGRGYGWKLVRLAVGPPPGAGEQGRARYVSGGYRGSDGAEVVAVWTEMGYSMSKALRFAFMGTGLTGLLGERWAIMAVMSAMGLFERERRSRQRRRF